MRGWPPLMRLVIGALSMAVLAAACASEGPPGDLGTRTLDFPTAPATEVVWESTVADIHPASRFREPPGGPDAANITRTILLAAPANEQLEVFLRTLDGVDVDVSDEGRLLRLLYRVDVDWIEGGGEEADRYHFQIEAPIEFTRLQKDGDVSLTVLLPREAAEYEEAPVYGVRLVETRGDSLGPVVESTAPDQRTTLFFHARQDPLWEVVYELFG